MRSSEYVCVCVCDALRERVGYGEPGDLVSLVSGRDGENPKTKTVDCVICEACRRQGAIERAVFEAALRFFIAGVATSVCAVCFEPASLHGWVSSLCTKEKKIRSWKRLSG